VEQASAAANLGLAPHEPIQKEPIVVKVEDTKARKLLLSEAVS